MGIDAPTFPTWVTECLRGELFSMGTAKHDTDAFGLGCHTLSLQSSTLESTDRTHEEATGIANGHVSQANPLANAGVE